MVDYRALIPLVFIVLNIITFAVYGLDKSKAKNGAWRISESTLVGMGAVCPWGALIGMQFFRHKTQKSKFKVIWVFAVLHMVIAALLIALL